MFSNSTIETFPPHLWWYCSPKRSVTPPNSLLLDKSHRSSLSGALWTDVERAMREQRPFLAQRFIKQTEGQGLRRSGYHNENCRLRNPLPLKTLRCLREYDKKEQTPWPSQRGSLDPARRGWKPIWERGTRGDVYFRVTACAGWHGVRCWSVIFAERPQPCPTTPQTPCASQEGCKAFEDTGCVLVINILQGDQMTE